MEQELFDLSEINELTKKTDYAEDLRFVHISDIHASKARKEQVLTVIAKLTSYVKTNRIPLTIISGDFWNSVITNTEASGFTAIIEAMKKLCFITHVSIISGTPTHEAYGSLDVFRNIGAEVFYRMEAKEYKNYNIIYFPEQRISNYDGDTIKNKQKNMLVELKKLSKMVKNRDYSKPLIVVYHGEIFGAYMDNGTKSDSVTALYISMVKEADYVACGHIHLPQNIDNCWYSGSVPPVDFGEEHDSGFNAVTIRKDRTVLVERISMGFPVNRTIKLNCADVDSFSKDLKNTNVKLSITCSDTDKKLINRKEIKDRFESLGAVSVSIHTESAKEKKETANEITKTSTLEEKFILWCKTQNIKYSESAVNKIRFLDENKLIKDMLPQHIFRLVWVDIRGAKGLYNFKDGSLYVDFRNYTGGLIVVAGDTGKGKTTFIENCHPYPQMFTREGKLQDQFFLKDSHRILCYVDEKGTYYKPEIYIDPKNDCKYFVETSSDGETWKKLTQCDGTLESYMNYINGTFGTKDVFLRTSFVVNSDSSITDIARASKGELAEFFSKLIGTDYIKILYKTACEKRKESDKELTSLSSSLKDSDSISANISNTEKDISVNTDNLSSVYKEISRNGIELESLKSAKKEVETTSSEEYIRNIKNRLSDIEKKLIENRSSINTYNTYISNKNVIDKLLKYISDKDTYTKEITSDTEKINSILSDTSELKTKKELLNKCIGEYSESLLKWTYEIEKLSHKIYKDGDKCPECGEIILESEKPELFIASKKYEVQVNILTKNKELTSELKAEKEKELDDLLKKAESMNEEYHTLKSKVEENKKLLSECTAFISEHDNLVPLCDYIPIDIESVNNDVSKLEKNKEAINKELEINETQDIESINAGIKSKENESDTLNKNKDKLLVESGALNTKLKLLEKEKESNNELKNKIDTEKHENEDWNCICDSLSNEGIQAMELKDKVPEITDTANAILEKIYGDKFTGYIKTDKESGKKTINEFIIMVTNNENGWDMPLKMVSTGERVWIEQAFFYAFSITGTEQSGSGYSVRFMDEKDGSLDSDLRGKYVEMINASHIAGNAYQTVLITHSQEIKDSAKQIINF